MTAEPPPPGRLVKFGRRQSKGLLLGLSGLRLTVIGAGLISLVFPAFLPGFLGLLFAVPVSAVLFAAPALVVKLCCLGGGGVALTSHHLHDQILGVYDHRTACRAEDDRRCECPRRRHRRRCRRGPKAAVIAIAVGLEESGLRILGDVVGSAPSRPD
jgi:hypothetical protein